VRLIKLNSTEDPTLLELATLTGEVDTSKGMNWGFIMTLIASNVGDSSESAVAFLRNVLPDSILGDGLVGIPGISSKTHYNKTFLFEDLDPRLVSLDDDGYLKKDAARDGFSILLGAALAFAMGQFGGRMLTTGLSFRKATKTREFRQAVLAGLDQDVTVSDSLSDATQLTGDNLFKMLELLFKGLDDDSDRFLKDGIQLVAPVYYGEV